MGPRPWETYEYYNRAQLPSEHRLAIDASVLLELTLQMTDAGQVSQLQRLWDLS